MLGMATLTKRANDVVRGTVSPEEPDFVGASKPTLVDGFGRPEPSLGNAANGDASAPVTLTLRVAEARVEDVGHAIVRVAPADLRRLGAQPGDTLKITGGTSGIGWAEVSEDSYEGTIQIDGTSRSNCRAGLGEQVTVTPIEVEHAVAVRLLPLWVGAAPAMIAPERMLEDLLDVPVMTGSVVRVPTFAKAVNFQVIRTRRFSGGTGFGSWQSQAARRSRSRQCGRPAL